MGQLDVHVAYASTDKRLLATNENEAPRPALTDLEAQILVLIWKGKQASEVAAALGTDRAVVKEHIKAILRKAIGSGSQAGRSKDHAPCAPEISFVMLSPFTA